MSQRQPGCERPLKTAANNSPNASPSLEKGQQPAPAKAPRLPRPFVLLNIPKTGTTYTLQYVRRADLLSAASLFGKMRTLQHSRISTRKWWRKRQAWLKPILPHGYMNLNEQHTPYSWLPPRLQSLPAITVLRQPISWQVSIYLSETHSESPFCRSILQNLEREECKSFVRKYLGGKRSIDAWCNISLEAHQHFKQNFERRWRNHGLFNIPLAEDFPIGPLGCQALTYLHREPARVFAMRAEEVEEYFASGHWRQDLCRVYLLCHEQLEEDLYRVMLEQLGYHPEILDAAREMAPARRHNVSPANAKNSALRELEQKPWLREEILQSERIYSQYILPLAGALQ